MSERTDLSSWRLRSGLSFTGPCPPRDFGLIAPTFAVVKNTLRNVPESMPSSFIFSTPVSVDPQQWYFSE
ncbi:hypothetical protein [Actinopolymorpha pittospori]